MTALRLESDVRLYSRRSKVEQWRGHITIHLERKIVGEAIVLPPRATSEEARFHLRRTLRLLRIAEWSDIIDICEENGP